ncbi:hypothetical protein [Nocardia sp. CNY236]|uniref:hypothetical protein n=1 Tax=Nocardia sp. CNY236 TaxID=1169152 RepID=UPI00048FA444|nr:hypothetical protein [Nocardia sp. CNY236]
MIRYKVTNREERERLWQVEPYGDVISLKPGDTMTVEYEHPAELTIEVLLNPGCDQTWIDTPPNILFPEDLKHNDVSVWG